MDSTFFNKTGYRILPEKKNVEVERIEEKYSGTSIFYLRVRNNSKKDIKINSFVVLEFFLPSDLKINNILENSWLQCGEVKYKKINDPTIKNKIFLQRDQNPYSFNEDYGYVDDSIVSEWFTSINFKNKKNLFLGAVTTKDQFSQVYVNDVNGKAIIRVTCQFDGLTLRSGQVVKSEKIFIRYGDEEDNKKEFAESIAHFMEVKKVKRPIKALCASYYWNGNKINEEIINDELEAIERMGSKFNLNYFQLDAGYTSYFGDWLSYKDRFPNGFEKIVKRIKNLGFEAGIWISPFAINPGTKLHDHHKSWLIKDGYKKHFEGRWTSPVDNIANITDLEVLDPTRPEVKEYLKKVLTHFKNLGFKLFKIDFMYPVCLSKNYSKPVTRAQALREGLEFIREVLGNEVEILTGITQLSSVVGIADYVRTGIDTLNPFVSNLPVINSMVNEYMFENNLIESENRKFLNGVVWRADPDVLVFRKDLGITEKQIKKQHKFIKENNMSMWIGDNISSLNENSKKKLIQYFNE